jgi:hypothetical protein
MIEDDLGELLVYAMVCVYGPPDSDLLQDSCHTLHAFPRHNFESNVQVIDIASIISVVSVQPLPKLTADEEDRLFVIEKSGIDDTELTGYVDPLENDGRH